MRKKQWMPDEKKKVVARILDLRTRGASDDAIAKRLMHEGFKTSSGLGVWQVATVWKLRKEAEKEQLAADGAFVD